MPAVTAKPTQASPRMSWSASCPEASRVPSRTASRMSPSTNKSPSAVPAKPMRSSGSPVMRPRVKLSIERTVLAASAVARSTFSTRAGSTGTPRSRASSRKLCARSASLAASAASISRAATAASNERATARSASATGSSWSDNSASASSPRGTIASAAIAKVTAKPSGNAIRAPVMQFLSSCHPSITSYCKIALARCRNGQMRRQVPEPRGRPTRTAENAVLSAH